MFYDNVPLTAARYRAWLAADAVGWVAVPHTRLDASARAEARLIAGGLPYLREVWHSADWRLYAVRRPTALVSGAARATTTADDHLTLTATRAGTAVVRVRWTPYWAVTAGDACVAPAGAWTRLRVRRPGPLRLAVRFDPRRIGARSERCHG